MKIRRAFSAIIMLLLSSFTFTGCDIYWLEIVTGLVKNGAKLTN